MVTATIVDAAKLGFSEHVTASIRHCANVGLIYAMGRREVVAECTVCGSEVPLASLFTACGADRVVCSQCTFVPKPREPPVPVAPRYDLMQLLRSTTAAIPVVDIVSKPGGASELRRLLPLGAVSLVEGDTLVVPDSLHAAMKPPRSRHGKR